MSSTTRGRFESGTIGFKRDYEAMKLLCCLLMVLPLAAADERVVSGLVTDEYGSPLEGVSIDHGRALCSDSETDSSGQFQISTNAPAIVFGKLGFAPQRLAFPLDNQRLHITLPVSALRAPRCSAACRDGLRGFLCLPQVKGVRVVKGNSDVDYSGRLYVAGDGRARGVIVPGRGPSWSLGVPESRDVWDSVNHAENDYRWDESLQVIDAGGQEADGGKWRYLGVVGESAAYSSVKDSYIAALLDQVLDRFCLDVRSSK